MSRLDPSSIELHIEELVLHGFSPLNQNAIGDATTQELERLLAGDGCGAQAREQEIERVDGGTFQLRAQNAPAGIGVQIAAAVHRAIVPQVAATKEELG